MKDFLKKHWAPILAFFIPCVICIGICIGNGVYPLGKNCILHIDMYHQYCPFFTEFMNKLKSADSLMYSWNIGLGSDFVAVYAYYLSSPLNWLLILCPKNHVIEFMTILDIFKISACGFTFYCFLDGHFKNVRKVPALVFATAYALCGFVAAYSWDIMWMDSVALTPLIILGLEKLVKENKVALYYITLAVSIFSNYYISIMICIFLVFYFVYLFINQKSGRVMATVRFAIYSLLAGGTGVILMLPEMKILSYSGSSSMSFSKTMRWYFGIIEELSRMCSTTECYTGVDHWPNLYAGAFSLLLIGLYILNRKISLKEKVLKVGMLVFFLISFANNYLDFIWHGFHYPDSLPGRQSFLFAFLVLEIGYEAVVNRKDSRYREIILSFMAVMALIIASAKVTDPEITDMFSFIITGIFVFAYFLLLMLEKLLDEDSIIYVREFAFVLVMAELIVNMAATGLYVTDRVNYTQKRDDYNELQDLAKEDADANRIKFYRIEDTERMTKNDDALYGYKAATQFSSLMNINVSHFYQGVYMEGGKNFYGYNGATPLTSAILSVRYVISDNPNDENELRTLVGKSGNNYLYRNNYCLPVGFMMGEEQANAWDFNTASKVSGINGLSNALGAKDTLVDTESYDQLSSAGTTTIDIYENGYYYADNWGCKSDNLTISSDNGKSTTYSKTSHKYLFELGYYNAGDKLKITNSNMEIVSFNIYKLNMNAVNESFARLNYSEFVVDDYSSTKMEGHIDAKKAGKFIMSIPNEEGWSMYVDDKKVEIEDYHDTFISTNLEAGEHKIRLEYKTPGLKEGALVSGGCVLIFVLLMLGRKKYANHKREIN